MTLDNGETQMTTNEAIAFLNAQNANKVREAATFYFDAAGADWDGEALSLLRNGSWYRHGGPSALPYGLARYMRRNLFVNARNGIENASITPSRWAGKTVKGAEQWAAEKLG